MSPSDLIAVGLADLDVRRDLVAAWRGRHAAVEDRRLAVNDRHVGQRQLEDVALVTTELRTEPTHRPDVFVDDLLGCGLFHDGVFAHDMALNVRPSD